FGPSRSQRAQVGLIPIACITALTGSTPLWRRASRTSPRSSWRASEARSPCGRSSKPYPSAANLFGGSTRRACRSANLCSRRIVLLAVSSVSLCHAAVEVSTLLDRNRLMSNVTDDMSLGLEHHVAALNWTFYPTVHDHPLRCNASNNLSIWRND